MLSTTCSPTEPACEKSVIVLFINEYVAKSTGFHGPGVYWNREFQELAETAELLLGILLSLIKITPSYSNSLRMASNYRIFGH
jgi:hypothetical protein